MDRMMYLWYLLLSKILGHQWIIKYYRKKGMRIGDDTHIFSRIVTGEPYLIEIGDHCTIATNVSLLTHDASIGAISHREVFSDLCGKITIGNNCFIGDKSIIMYGVSIADNVIVAAGSVVVKSIKESGVIVGGVPARVLGSTEDFKKKYSEYFYSLHGLSYEEKERTIMENPQKLVVK